ncbi:hypothetical protein C6499_23010 [Candidatus Poribacteria bacterium]|nr:MAG: hypothetical protein C6499_23010 [Candidatus Poribacteria bacterium]
MRQQDARSITQETLPPPKKMTLEEFLESDLEGYEYVKGELIPMPAASWKHGIVSARIFLCLGLYVRENQLGEVVTPDTGFQVGERVLKPDVAFLSTAHLPDDTSRASPLPPDLAVEVVSPSDVFRRVIEKAFAYLEAGTQMVWIVEPTSQTVRVYRSEMPIRVLGINDTLTGEDVVEGFSCQVSQLFE